MSDYNTDLAPGLSPGLGEAPKPAPVAPTNTELETSLFHTQNSLGSVIQRMSRGSYTPQAGYNPIDDLKTWADQTIIREHGSSFLGSQSPEESVAIWSGIQQGQKDRAAIAASGWNGTVAGLRMGLVDPTMFLPAGKAVQLAREVTQVGRAADVALNVGKTAVMQASAQEALLQASQPERTLEESAINVGSSTLLAALIGGGGYALLAKEGLVDKGIASLDSARVKLSEHNGVIEKAPPVDPAETGPAGNMADPVFSPAANIHDVYHGTGASFDKFDPGLRGSATEAPSAKEAFFFSKSHETAEAYLPKQYALRDQLPPDELARLVDLEGQLAKEKSGTSTRSKISGLEDQIQEIKSSNTVYEDGANVRQARVRLDNPLIHDFEGKKFREQSYAKIIAEAKAAGHDGVIFKNTYDGGPLDDVYAVFDPSQITGRHEPAGTGQAMAAGANYTKDANGTIRYSNDDGEGSLIVREVPKSATVSQGTFDASYSADAAGKFVAIRVREDLQQTLLPSGGWVSKPEKPRLFDTAEEAEAAAKQSLGLRDTAPPAGTGMAMAAGAAPSDTRNLSPVPYGLDSIPGVRTAVAKMFPNLDVLTNGAVPAKAALSEMVDTPIALMANKEGQTATRSGGPTIERELKQQREGLHWQADQEMLKQWGDYLGQEGGGTTFMQRQTGTAPAGKMSFDDFNASVYDALSTGDTHPTPQVAAMAQWVRKNGLDPIKERALKSIEGFKETVTRPGETYAPRLWDKEKISANWNDYVGTWTDHLVGEQATKAQSQERLGVYQGALESHRATIDKYEARIAKLSEDSDVIAARQEETTRINKAANRRAETLRTRDQDTLPLTNAQGGAVFETLARNRGNLLAERASAKLAEIESLQTKMAAEVESHNTMRQKIEAEIAAWEGKSATEAKSALKARAEAEKAREVKKAEGTYKGKEDRLSSADKAVDSAVRNILESERTLDRQDLKARAEEIAGRVIGTPEGRLPYDASMSGEAIPGAASDLRGHAGHREIDIPYEMAKPWLRRSATEALKSYTHSVLPDAMLAERFDGDPNLTIVMKEIESAYAAKRAEAKTEAAQNKLKSQMDSDIKNVAAMRDRIRGTFGYDPTMQGLARFSQNALKINNIISSHGMAVASLPDFAGVVFRHGLESAFKDAWIPFANSMMDKEAWAAVKAAGDEWKAFGIGIEMHSASRNHALSDIAEHYRPNSKFERALTWASDKAFVVNLLAPLTDLQKRMATNAVASNVLRASEAVAGGKATRKQIEMLAAGNITEAQAARIWDQWSNNGGERVKGIILPNMDKWTDQAAAKVFRGAVGRDVDIAVVSPGYGETPKFMSKPGFNVLAQYKKFTISATQRVLISNLQRHDAGTMAGLVTAVGMGMLAYKINSMSAGRPTSDRVQDWVKEGVSRGGILGVIDDSNSIISKATGGKADMYRAIGADKPLSKFVSRDAASMFLGPTWGKLTNMTQVTRAATHPSEWGESDTHALRMMTLGTNFPYLPQLFDKVESGANHAFGIPMKAKP